MSTYTFTPETARRFLRRLELTFERGVPVLKGVIVSSSPAEMIHVHVWCPWCQAWHRHGTGGPEAVAAKGVVAGDGLRQAHCTDHRETPFWHTGGYIVRGTKFVDKSYLTQRKPTCLGCGGRFRSSPGRPYHDGCFEDFASEYGLALDAE